MDKPKQESEMRVVCWFLFLLLSSCGVESEISSQSDKNGDGVDDNIEIVVEEGVTIREVVTNHKGTKVQCRLNDLIKDLQEEVQVFIEFEGVEIERGVFKNAKAPVNFDFYNPPVPGNLLCVIEFAGAEFESSPHPIAPQ